MNYEAAVSWVDRFHQFGIQLSLNRIQQVLENLNNPHQQIQCIHVAGTNGKGSVCRFINSILTSEGYKTGLYLSPHLVDFRERFQLNGTYISKHRFVDIVEEIQSVVDEFVRKKDQLTYFEVCTIIAFVFFAKEQVDYAIVEVGLGGRYDATNVIDPLVSVITNVSFDHQHVLGDTIQEITTEKAGIIKDGTPVVTGATDDALSVIRKICEKRNCSLSVVSKEKLCVKEASSSHQTILYHGMFDDYLVSTHQIGCYQPINIAVSIAAIEVLQQQGVFIRKESILKGMKKMKHPGRMHILREQPLIIVDGAHNPAAIKLVVHSITTLFSYDRFILIFGVMKDKAILEMLRDILPLADLIIVTEPRLDRSANCEEVANLILSIDDSKKIMKTHSVHKAIEQAITIADTSDLILITGSLFTVAEVLEYNSKK
jgi:dihydrofolate synthase/folylpolyglutamate synthase